MDQNGICCTIKAFLEVDNGIVAALLGSIITLVITYLIQANGIQIVVDFTNRWKLDALDSKLKTTLIPKINSIRPVGKFHLYEFNIKNNSVPIAEEIELVFRIIKSTKDNFTDKDFIWYAVEDENKLTKIEVDRRHAKERNIILKRICLHSYYGRNKVELIITIVSNLEVEVSVSGETKKWRAKFIDSSYKKRQTKIEKGLRVLAVTASISLVVTIATYAAYNFSPVNLVVSYIIFLFLSMSLIQLSMFDSN